MKNNITKLEIKNFKSIKDIKLDCKRINLFIGEPNVGKSNILEALSLFITPFSLDGAPVLSEYIRYEKLSNLFYDQDRKNIISVETNLGAAYMRFHISPLNVYDITISSERDTKIIPQGNSIDEARRKFEEYRKKNPDLETASIQPYYHWFHDGEKFSADRLDYSSPIKKYVFKTLLKHVNHYSLFLSPPDGNNLFTILESNPGLNETASKFFEKYGLDLLLDTEANKLDVQKKIGSRVYKVPYSLAADTLQRLIFHLAAIESNDDSVILFEEPEANSFPPYVSLLAETIAKKANNQFFITTHSPYILTPFIEQCSYEEAAVFICKYENFETKVKALSKKEIENIMDTGIDLFFNIPAFKK